METFKVRISGKTMNLQALTARDAARQAFALEKGDACEILNKQKARLAIFSRDEVKRVTFHPMVDGKSVTFSDDYQVITLHCLDETHAAQVARAMMNGVMKFSSKAE